MNDETYYDLAVLDYLFGGDEDLNSVTDAYQEYRESETVEDY